MSWFDTFGPALIQGGLMLGGAVIQSNASQKAANTAANASNQATAAQIQGLQLAQDTIAKQQAAAAPGFVQMQNIIQRGNQLTPTQLTALDDARTTALNALAGSGLRGSARATAATVKKVDGDMRNQFLTQNQGRADTAASTLTGQYFNAGNNLANNQTAQGNSVASGFTNIGDISAAQTLGSANTTGKALGDIGAIIANEMKRDNRKSAYETPTQGA